MWKTFCGYMHGICLIAIFAFVIALLVNASARACEPVEVETTYGDTVEVCKAGTERRRRARTPEEIAALDKMLADIRRQRDAETLALLREMVDPDSDYNRELEADYENFRLGVEQMTRALGGARQWP